MTFKEVLAQVMEWLQQDKRLSSRALKRQFALADDYLDDLKRELIEVRRVAVEEDDQILVWMGGADAISTPPLASSSARQPATQEVLPSSAPPPAALASSDAERRQLTVLFCDLVDSTALSSQLDPEDLREVVRAYQDTCAKVIARFEGHIAQYLGDGLLVYFGYPQAHEDDAQRAVRAGLGIIEAMGQLHPSLGPEREVHLDVRLGIHTGLVVVGDVGGGARQEQLALGETPNLAARLQGLAAPNTLVISAATFQLLGGFFACQPLGTRLVKGLAQPLAVYRVLYESMARSRLEAAGSTGWTPLVGREQESALLLERWAQVKDGMGQVVLLSGEAGIGKSRLVQVLQEQVAAEPQAWLTPCQCSPYYQHTALYPLIDMLERVALRFEREESPPQKLSKLEGFLVQYGLPLAEAVPLFAALLSLPLPVDYAPVQVPPAQQKQQTLQALLTIFLRIAARQPVLLVMEDLHWVDPTTLDFLTLLVDQGPTARMLALLTFRPDFTPPWTGRSHLTQVTVPRLPRRQAVQVSHHLAHGKTLPPEVVEQIVAKTDGVPLFVEELTKMLLESGLLQEQPERYTLTGPLLPLAIPTTLHDSLMARLDRLGAVKGLAQLAATLGREFAYALLHAVSPWDEGTVQRGLHQLVAAELLYQRGLPPQATYLFKHALIQDAAYQSLLKSTRQQYHQRIAQVVEAQFPATVETQPELLAHHYTEAGVAARAVAYWQRAGARSHARSAYVEAVAHLTTGLAVLQTLPETTERTQRELDMQVALGQAVQVTKGFAAPEVGDAYARARALCHQVGDPARLFVVLAGLGEFYRARGALATARDLGEQCLALAQRQPDPDRVAQASAVLGRVLFFLGAFVPAQAHLERALALAPVSQDPGRTSRVDRVASLLPHGQLAWILWLLGYPDQALARSQATLAAAQASQHAVSLARALHDMMTLQKLRGEAQAAQAWADAAVALMPELGFGLHAVPTTFTRGWALAAQGRHAEGLAQMRQGQAERRAVGAGIGLAEYPTRLGEAYGRMGQAEEGLRLLAEALAVVDKDPWYEAEMHRIKGELLLRQAVPEASQAEACFHQALAVARRQQAKAWELRAAMSLGRLWQQQGKRDKARALLAPLYGWFTEGFATPDLQEAKALLAELEG